MPGRIHEESSAMKHIILPIPLIDSPIGELISPISMMFAILPLSLVDRSIRIVIRSLSFHLILLPLSLVEFFSNDAGRDVLDGEDSVTVFLLHSLEEMPMALVKCTAGVVKSSVALKLVRRDFWDDFLWWLFDHFFLYLFLRAHACEFIIIETYAGNESSDYANDMSVIFKYIVYLKQSIV